MLRLQGGEARLCFLIYLYFFFLFCIKVYTGCIEVYASCILPHSMTAALYQCKMMNAKCKMKVFPSEMIIICPQSGHHNSAFSI